MSDADLIDRLRAYRVWSVQHSRYDGVPLASEAADRIEALAGLLDDMEQLKNTYRDDCHLAEARAESAERSATAWHRVVETIATVLGLPEPEADFAAKVRGKFDALNEQVHDANGVADLAIKHRDIAERALAEAVEIMRPFADVAEHDTGEDESDEDLFRPMTAFNRAKLLRVGHLRAARDFITAHEKEKGR